MYTAAGFEPTKYFELKTQLVSGKIFQICISNIGTRKKQNKHREKLIIIREKNDNLDNIYLKVGWEKNKRVKN
jgi:hypothetical protein